MGRLYSFDFGAGFPQLLGGEVALLILPRWQAGAGYGLLPGLDTILPKIELQELSAALPDGNTYTLSPSVTTSLSCMSPFIRFFPAPNPFYIQLTYSMLATRFSILATLKDNNKQPVPGAELGGDVTLVQAMPTISLGHLFMSRLLLFNISVGISVLGSNSSSVKLTSSLPDELGGEAANNALLNPLEADIDVQTNAAVTEFRRTMVLIPSLWLSFGLIF